MSGKKNNRKKAGPKAFDKRKTKFVLYNTLPQMPNEMDTIVTSGFVVDNAGATLTVTGYLATNSLLTSSHSGATVTASLFSDELGKFYESYRVVAYSLEYHWVSRSATDAQFAMVHVAEDPGFQTGSAFPVNSLTFANVHFLLVAGTGKSPCMGSVKTPKIWTTDVVGTDAPMVEENYVGGVNSAGVYTAPASLTYATYASGLATGTFAASSSPYLFGKMTQWVKFYARRF